MAFAFFPSERIEVLAGVQLGIQIGKTGISNRESSLLEILCIVVVSERWQAIRRQVGEVVRLEDDFIHEEVEE